MTRSLRASLSVHIHRSNHHVKYSPLDDLSPSISSFCSVQGVGVRDDEVRAGRVNGIIGGGIALVIAGVLTLVGR